MIRIIEIGQKSDKTPLIAIPGIDGSIGSIERIVNKVAENRRVIVIDYSEENNITLEALAKPIAKLPVLPDSIVARTVNDLVVPAGTLIGVAKLNDATLSEVMFFELPTLKL